MDLKIIEIVSLNLANRERWERVSGECERHNLGRQPVGFWSQLKDTALIEW